MATLLTTRETLAKGLHEATCAYARMPEDVCPVPHMGEADALLASGAVIDAATLAEPLCRNICDLLGEPRILVPGEVSALLAATLADRGDA